MSKDVIISLKNLTMSFGSHQVLKGIDLEVYKGEIIGYIGSNGAGKSTTIKILLGLLGGFGGEMKLFGQEITGESLEIKKRIGYVPEMAEIYDNLSAREYLQFIGGFYNLSEETIDQKARRLMEILGIRSVYESRISSFSKGMRQKLLIISSLIHDPDLIFLDEPLNGLDANSVIVIKEIFAMLKAQGKTIFYSSHIMDVVEKISDRIIILNEGEIAADGSFAELKNSSMTGSLEQLFNQLTGFHEHQKLAEEFVQVMRELK